MNTTTPTNGTYVVTGADLVKIYTITVADYPSELLTTNSTPKAAVLLNAAKSRGRVLFMPALTPGLVELAAPIGKPTTHTLHIEPGRPGYKGHYALAGEVLISPVSSLAALSTAERDLVREYAYGQMAPIVGGWAA